MINLFESVSPVQVSILVPSLWDLVHSGLCDNVSKVQDHYRTYARPASATHPLLRVLVDLGEDWQYPLAQYVEKVKGSLLRIAGVHGITTSTTPGHRFSGHFYDNHITEFYLGYIGSFSHLDADVNWTELQSVHVLTHPKSDLLIPILDGRPYSSQSGIVVIAVDLLKLAIQYRAYLRHINDPSVSGQGSVQLFLSRVILPNMLPSHMDMVILNRLFDQVNGSERVEVEYQHPMALPSYEKHLDRVISTVIHNLDRINPEYHHQLFNIPALYHDNIHRALILPDVLQTTQVGWLLILSRLYQFYNLVHLHANSDTVGLNRQALIELKRTVVNTNAMHMLESKLPGDFYLIVRQYLTDLGAIN